MEYTAVTYEVSDRIATITLNRPERMNSFSTELLAEWADAINILRIQRERMGIGIIPSKREYRNLFGINQQRLNKFNKEIVVLHPGPINRGVEISSDVADGENAIILNQVLNGVAIRMSVLFLLLGGTE